MKKKQNVFVIIIRWIAVPIVFLLAQGILRIIWDLTISTGWFINPEMLIEINEKGTLTSGYIWGFLYVSAREAIGVGISIFGALYTAPSAKKAVIFITSILWLTLSVAGGFFFLIMTPHTVGEWVVMTGSLIGPIAIPIYCIINANSIIEDLKK